VCPDVGNVRFTSDVPTPTPGVGVLADETMPASMLVDQPFVFNPTVPGSVVTATVTGDVVGSRPVVEVFDPFGVNTTPVPGVIPSANTSSVSFVPFTTGPFVLNTREVGIPSSNFRVLITER